MDAKSPVTRWVVIALLVLGLAAAWEGFGLVFGFLLVTVPGKAQQNLADQPGPTWVLLLGLALGAFGVAVVGGLYYVAKRRGRPLLAATTRKPGAWLESGRVWGVILGVTIAIPLVFVSVVSPHSALRPVPAAVAVMLLIVSIWYGQASAKA